MSRTLAEAIAAELRWMTGDRVRLVPDGYRGYRGYRVERFTGTRWVRG